MRFNPKQFSPNARLLNPQQQNPDEYFSGPASSVSAWAPMLMQNGSVRLAFAEQVFREGKQHFRSAVEMPLPIFNMFVQSLVEFQQQANVPTNAIKEVSNARNS
jgi:hypothetical protein